MSTQQTLSGQDDHFRSIVKDAYDTRDENDTDDTTLEIVAWRVDKDRYIPPSEGREGVENPIKTVSGNLRYGKILDTALEDVGAGTLAERTALKSYADDRGGRAASTIRGYRQNRDRLAPKTEGGLPSSHPVKRVLRRYARSQELGHFVDDTSGDEGVAVPPRAGRHISGEIDLSAMKAAYRLARSIASQEGFGFAPQEGEPVAVEDNELIDPDEVRAADRPLGDTKAMCMLTKPSGSVYEYHIYLDDKTLEPAEGTTIPPGGW